MKRLAIIGSGDLGQQIRHLAVTNGHFNVVGYFDDFIQKGSTKGNLPILGKTDEIIALFKENQFDFIVCAIGYKHKVFRKMLVESIESTVPFATLIHSTCIIDSSAKIGQGAVLYPGCIVDMNAQVGKHAIMYSACLISHDVMLGAHCMLSPGVKIAGFSKIGESVHLGIGTVVADTISIVNDTITGAGTVVVKSITEAGTYVGIPSKLIQR